MPTVTVGFDAELRVDNEASWALARDRTTAESVRATAQAATARASGASSKFDCYRYMAGFDTSGISGTVSSATLKLFGHNFTNADLIVVKVQAGATGNSSTNFVAADYNKIEGFVAGSTMDGNVTTYSSEITSWTAGAVNNITLNSDALSDLSSLNEFKLAIITNDHDFLNVAPPGSTFRSGWRSANFSTVSLRPTIEFTISTSTGYSNNVLGVAAANIAKVDGVAVANISKINGVE